jgi:hypothetical protein
MSSAAWRYSSASQSLVETSRLDRDVAGLGRLEGHPGFSEPGEAGVSELVAGGPFEPGSVSRRPHDHINAVDAQPLSSTRTLESHEDPLGRTVRRSFFA